jgi:hypothetical protein
LVDSHFRSKLEHLCSLEEAHEQRALLAARNKFLELACEQLIARELAAARGVKRRRCGAVPEMCDGLESCSTAVKRSRALQALTNKAEATAKADPRRSARRK